MGEAMRNIMWAASLLATLPTAEARREAFAGIAAEAVRATLRPPRVHVLSAVHTHGFST